MKISLVVFFFIFLVQEMNAQSVGIGTNTPNSNSLLDMGPGLKPVILPRLNLVQRDAIPPVPGMLIFNTSHNAIQFSDGVNWISISTQFLLPEGTVGQTIRHNGANWVNSSLIWNNGTYVNINSPNTNSSYRLNVIGQPDYGGIRALGNYYGIEGEASIYGVIGTSTYLQGGGAGVKGNSIMGDGVLGSSEQGVGVRGTSSNPNPGNGIGVIGVSTNGDGVHGFGNGVGVYGNAQVYGVYGNATGGIGVFGKSETSNGIRGQSTSGRGVYGISSSSYGVFGESSGTSGGVRGVNNGSGAGVEATGPAYGIYAHSTNGHAVFGTSPNGFAGYFEGPKTYIQRLGVGTGSPLAPLHVAGNNVLNSASAYYFGIDYTGAVITTINPGSWATGLLVDNDIVGRRSIVSAQNVVTSDARLKEIIGVSDSKQDLELARKISVVNYHYKDKANWGQTVFKKVIAQQIEEIYPQAVFRQSGVVPDIYTLADKTGVDTTNHVLTVHLHKSYGIKPGEKIQLIHPARGQILVSVISVEGNSFTCNDWHGDADKLFVFGRETNDIRTVDYEALFMLGISAMQQMAKENDEFRVQLQKLVEQVVQLKSQLASLKEKSSQVIPKPVYQQ
ncbi:MAG TPA: tail fiber domain-containing protein [Chitinophagaceae bacterium]|nr:tail fiber domain-containing protein [Chitinophagaceae bacterium]